MSKLEIKSGPYKKVRALIVEEMKEAARDKEIFLSQAKDLIEDGDIEQARSDLQNAKGCIETYQKLQEELAFVIGVERDVE